MSDLPNKRVVFSLGGKGGVGKSFVIKNIVDWYETLQRDFVAFDLDNENSTFQSFYPKANYVDVADQTNLDQMMNTIVEDEKNLFVVDMRAASTDRIEPWLRNIDFDELRTEQHVKFTAIAVVDTSLDSVENIEYWSKDVLHGDQNVEFVIARNLVRGSELGYDKSAKREQYKTSLDAQEIEIPKMEEWIHALLEDGKMRISDALRLNSPNHKLGQFMNRTRLKRYQAHVFGEFERIKTRLLP